MRNDMKNDIKKYMYSSYLNEYIDIMDIQEKLEEAIMAKPGQHCFNNKPERTDRRSMSQIGG